MMLTPASYDDANPNASRLRAVESAVLAANTKYKAVAVEVVAVVVAVVESALEAVAVSVEFDEAVVASLAVEAAVEVVADVVVAVVVAVVEVVSVLVLAAVDVVEVVEVVVLVLVLADESLDSDEQMLEKPLARSYTFTSRPLVGTSRVQSGGLSEVMDSMAVAGRAHLDVLGVRRQRRGVQEAVARVIDAALERVEGQQTGQRRVGGGLLRRGAGSGAGGAGGGGRANERHGGNSEDGLSVH
ncbi:hypothetical protein PF002_g29335, partial [Phytophthora fragariae]